MSNPINVQQTQPSSDRGKTIRLVQTAVLAAILILMAFTPLGYLKIGVVSITFMMIPVVIGAIVNGPAYGAFLGAVFGATSFAQCFGLDWFGTSLLAINPFYTFVMTMVPRIMIGIGVALIFRFLTKFSLSKIWVFSLSALSGALINTILFVGALILFFGNTDFLRQFGDNILAILGVLITFNALIEAAVCAVLGGMVAGVLHKQLAQQN